MEIPKPSTKRDRRLMESLRGRLCVVCGKSNQTTGSHLRSKGSGGPDTEWNVVPMCFYCHREWEDGGLQCFLSKHHRFEDYLEELGWEVLKFDGQRWRISRKDPSG